MTLVGVFVYKNSVSIISDILLSEISRFSDPKPIPSIGYDYNNAEINFTHNLEKIYMLSSKNLIAFAGSPFCAQECIKDIKNLQDWNDFDKIREIMTKYQKKGKFSCIYVNKNAKKVTLLATSKIYEDFCNFDYVCAIGSGSDIYLEYLKKIDENFEIYFPYLQNDKIFRDLSNIEVNIFVILQILSEFYKDDFLQNGISIQKRYGGYYEVILEYNDHFRKLSNYHLCIWYYRNRLFELKTKFHSIYTENGLTINKIDFKGKNYIEQDFKLRKLENYYPNLENEYNTENIDYNIDYDCFLNIVFSINEMNRISNVKFLIGSNSFDKSIKLKIQDGKVIRYELSSDFKKQLSDLISLK